MFMCLSFMYMHGDIVFFTIRKFCVFELVT